MASWETQATTSSFDANAAAQTMIDGRNRGSVSGGIGLNTGGYGQTTSKQSVGINWFGVDWGRNDYMKTSGYDIVGINGNQVEPMRQAIRDYVSEVQSLVESTLSTSEEQARNAFRGDDAISAVNAYIDKIKAYCQNITSTLLSFSDKLADVGNAWRTAQENIAGNVNAATGSFTEGTAYTESVQYNR